MTDEETGKKVRVWLEVATVKLPLRAHRRSAVLPALKQARAKGEKGQRFRVLDEAAAQELELTEKPQPPVEERFEVVAVDAAVSA